MHIDRPIIIEDFVIIEDFGFGVTTRTQVQTAQVVYQMLRDGKVQWQEMVYFSKKKDNQKNREHAAREQDRQATSLVRELEKLA